MLQKRLDSSRHEERFKTKMEKVRGCGASINEILKEQQIVVNNVLVEKLHNVDILINIDRGKY